METEKRNSEFVAAYPLLVQVAGQLFRCPRQSRIEKLQEFDDYLADVITWALEDWPEDGFTEVDDLYRFVSQCVNRGHVSGVCKVDITAHHRNKKRPVQKDVNLEKYAAPVMGAPQNLPSELPMSTLEPSAQAVFSLLLAGDKQSRIALKLFTSRRQVRNICLDIATALELWLSCDCIEPVERRPQYKKIVADVLVTWESLLGRRLSLSDIATIKNCPANTVKRKAAKLLLV